ncbi:MAG: tRNA-dihydrouridine synthase family protein [Patescibacteria group bacterium]
MPVDFWKKLNRRSQPILALAPMAGFTDSVFRQLCKKYGADVLYSEMASATALYYSTRDNATLELLRFERRKEKYYVVQLFGSDPEHFAAATRIIAEKIKPDGIDINFGCPVPKVCRQGAGAALMKDLKNSRAVVEAVLANTDLPVSIKIRTKAGSIDALEFLKNISDLPVAALMIHGRTLAQGFVGAPDFKIVKKARQYFKGVILANGGINNLTEARVALKESGADGLGLARGVLGRPWLFKEIKENKEIKLKPREIFKIMLGQAAAVEKQKGQSGILELRKHLAWYAKGLPGAARLREKLVKVNSLEEVKNVLGD